MVKKKKSEDLEEKYGSLENEKAKRREEKKRKKEDLVHGRDLFEVWKIQMEKSEKEIKKRKKK